MKDDIIIYEKPTCSTCRIAKKLLQSEGVSFKSIRYYEAPLSEKKLSELLKKMDISARELLRTKESIYVKLGLAKKDLSEKELIKLMIKYPDLMQRPIIERGNRAVLGRPPEELKKLI